MQLSRMKLWPSVGTRSVLFGVHQFLWHPLTVGLAWRRLYKTWPTRWEWLAIFLHDLGYWGKTNMDGESGKQHPITSWMISVRWSARLRMPVSPGLLRAESLILGHSRSFCVLTRVPVSSLCDPDKLSVLYDPAPFYWLRGIASGEIFEYRRREEDRRGEKFSSVWAWLQSYRRAIRARFSERLRK